MLRLLMTLSLFFNEVALVLNWISNKIFSQICFYNIKYTLENLDENFINKKEIIKKKLDNEINNIRER